MEGAEIPMKTKETRIAWVHPRGRGPEAADDIQIDTFVDAKKILERPGRYDIVWVDAEEREFAQKAVERLRADRYYAIAPLFLSEKSDEMYESLCDGWAYDIKELLHKSTMILSRIKHLEIDALLSSASLALLGHLYVRPGRELRTRMHWKNEWIDLYPIVSVLNDTGFDDFQWLTLFYRRGLLEKSELLDRIRLCPKCNHPHHNYIDICPTCRVIEIEKVDFVHCFTCGYVGPEREFLKDGILVCPNCKTELRHIGVDYDRPVESYICANGHKFVEPAVVARCLECGAMNRPEDLVPKEVYAFRLTADGALAVKTGTITDIYAVLEQENFVHPEYFESLLDWMIKLHRRMPEETFSVLAVRMLNILELVDRLGRARVIELLDEFATRLREILRSTDVTTRTNETDLWILLPKTPKEGCETVKERIGKMESLIEVGFGNFKLDLVCASVEEVLEEKMRAKDLMASLSARLRYGRER